MGVKEIFKSFGYDASPEEIAAISPTFAGNGGEGRGRASVGHYVNTMKKLQEAERNDPLNAVIKDEKGFINDSERKAAEAEGFGTAEQARLEKTITDAPKLFGSLDEGQIDNYLAPVDRASQESSSRLEGAFGRRGLVGSSTEANALASNNRQFKENVLRTGLDVGMTQKSALAQAISDRIAHLNSDATEFRGLANSSRGRVLGASGQLSTIKNDNARYTSELPIALRGISAQERAIEDAIQARKDAAKKAKKRALGSMVGGVVGGVAGAFVGGPAGAMAGYGLGSGLGGSVTGGGQIDPSLALYAAQALPTNYSSSFNRTPTGTVPLGNNASAGMAA